MENGVSVGEGQGNRRLPFRWTPQDQTRVRRLRNKNKHPQHTTTQHPPSPTNLLLLLLTCQIHFSDVERLWHLTLERQSGFGWNQYMVLSHNLALRTNSEASLHLNGEYIYLVEHLYCTFLSDNTVATIQRQQLDWLMPWSWYSRYKYMSFFSYCHGHWIQLLYVLIIHKLYS